jgi:DNA-binding response OmpR family regulator
MTQESHPNQHQSPFDWYIGQAVERLGEGYWPVTPDNIGAIRRAINASLTRQPGSTYRHLPHIYLPKHGIITDGKGSVRVTPIEGKGFAILKEYFPDRVTPEEIAMAIWGDAEGRLKSLQIHIGYLRAKLHILPGRPPITIVNHQSRGYSLETRE